VYFEGVHIVPDGMQYSIAEFGSNQPFRYPFDAELASLTLWPEIEKVFGHGYEARFRFALIILFINTYSFYSQLALPLQIREV
jgi:hypothetical protein